MSQSGAVTTIAAIVPITAPLDGSIRGAERRIVRMSLIYRYIQTGNERNLSLSTTADIAGRNRTNRRYKATAYSCPPPPLERLDVPEPGGVKAGECGGIVVVRVVEHHHAARADRVVEVVDLVAGDLDAREVVHGAAVARQRAERGAAAAGARHAGAARVGHHPLAVGHVVGEVVGVLGFAHVHERDRRFIVRGTLGVARHDAHAAHVDSGLPGKRRLDFFRVRFGKDPYH